MKFADITRRTAGLGSDLWGVYYHAQKLIAEGKDIVSMTIGQPDVPTPPELIDVAKDALDRGRTGYSEGRGENNLRSALANQYSTRRGHKFGPNNVLCLPGTQTALFTAMMGVAETGDEVLVGDPLYATYEGIIRATGATPVMVPLRPENGFRISAEDIEARVTERTTAILLTTPHNPTGAVLSDEDIRNIGTVAKSHDLWIVSDEVYEDLVFEGVTFASPLDHGDLLERSVVVASISKSHAAPGFRSGWIIGSLEFCNALLPLSESMLFGNQPFIADVTEHGIRHGSSVAPGMARRFAARASRLNDRLAKETNLTVHQPEAGMFALINVASTGMDGTEYAWSLLEHGVAVMPGASFGSTIQNWVRVALTVEDGRFDQAIDRMISHAQSLQGKVA